MTRGGLRRSFGWNAVGVITYQVVLWLLVVMVARWGSSTMVGQYALAQALAAPVFLTVGLNLRAVRATDVQRRWTRSQYTRVRLGLNGIAILVTLLVAVLAGLRDSALLVSLAVALSKASEATSQTIYGYFQLRTRLDLVARSMLLRSASGALLFLTGLLVVDRLVAGCAGLALGWYLTYRLHDRPAQRRLELDDPQDAPTGAEPVATSRHLLRRALPLGADAGVNSVTLNTPRFGIHTLLGTAALGLYAPLAYLGQVVSMVTGTLADTLISGLARAAMRGDRAGFTRLMLALVGFGVGVATAAVVVVALVGEPAIRLLVGEEYVNQPVLVTLVAGAGLLTVHRCLTKGLQALHRFTQVLVCDAISLLVVAPATFVLVPRWELVGAAAVLGAGYGVGALVAAALLVPAVRRLRPD